MKTVTFNDNCKQKDGELLPGSSRMWIPATTGKRLRPILAGLNYCLQNTALPIAQLDKLTAFLGTSGCYRDLGGIDADRTAFDVLISTYLHTTRIPIPTSLHQAVVAVRHSLAGPQRAINGPTQIICLFPVSACRKRWVEDRSYQYDGGWRTDGMWLWLGQRQRSSHKEVLQALEDACGTRQAVLVFSRRRQSGTPHVFVGRAQGYLPVAEQDAANQQPYRAALMMDTTTPFELAHEAGKHRMLPGWQTPAGKYTKEAVHTQLGLQPPKKFHRWGWSISSVTGFCNTVPRPIDVVHKDASDLSQ